MIAASSDMRVALFIETGGPGGAERVVFNLAQSFHQSGIGVFVVTMREGWLTESLDTAGIKRFVLPSPGARDFTFPFRLAKILKSERATVLHSHLLDSNFYGSIAARIAGIPHVGTEHGDVHHTVPKKATGIKLRTISFLGTRMIAVSKFTADRMVELGYRGREPLVFLNPIETLKYQPASDEEKARLRLKHGARVDTEWIWLHVANLRPVKDQGTLIRGFAAACAASGRKQELWIVGDGDLRPELEKLAAELGLSERVRFHGFQSDPLEFYQAADGFVLSSISEALPLSILEAAATELFVVGSEVGGIPEIVTQDRGRTFPRGDTVALGHQLSWALEHPSEVRQSRKIFSRYVHETCSSEALLANHIALFNSLVR